jgi:hypothetical protein
LRRRALSISSHATCKKHERATVATTTGGKEPDLGALLVYVFEDCLVCRVVEPSLDPPFFIILESGAEPLRAVVEGVSERFMDTIKCFLARQESLVLELESKTRNTKHLRSSLTLSKAVEQARGCVATKMGLVDILVGSRASAQTMLQVDARQPANRKGINCSSDHSFSSNTEHAKIQEES